MSTTATQPTQLTIETLRDMFVQKAPHFLPKFDEIKPELYKPSGTDSLRELIQRPVVADAAPERIIYSWESNGRSYEMSVPTSDITGGANASLFDDKGAASDGDIHKGRGDRTSSKEDEPTSPQNALEPPTQAQQSTDFFSALLETVGTDTFFMTLCGNGATLRVTLDRTDKEEEDPFDALCLEGTPAELEADFGKVLRSRAKAQHDFAAQVAALKRADDALVEVKKKEADAKKKKADKREASAEKEEKKVEAEKAQQSIF